MLCYQIQKSDLLKYMYQTGIISRATTLIYNDTINLHQKIAFDHNVISIYFNELFSPTAYRNTIKYSKKKQGIFS